MDKKKLHTLAADYIRKKWDQHFFASVIYDELHVYHKGINVAQTGRDGIIFGIDKAVMALVEQLLIELKTNKEYATLP